MTTMMEDYMTSQTLLKTYENSGLIAGLIEYLKQYDISRLKISSKRVHLGFGGINSNLEEDEGMRRRTSVMEVTKHQV